MADNKKNSFKNGNAGNYRGGYAWYRQSYRRNYGCYDDKPEMPRTYRLKYLNPSEL
jgi:hypothetical protein